MVCELAQSMDILTVAFATLPFTFEGRHRRTQALEAGKRMAKSVDSMVVVPNDKLLGSSIERTVVDAFKYADSALVQGVRGISDIIMVSFPSIVRHATPGIKSSIIPASTDTKCSHQIQL